MLIELLIVIYIQLVAVVGKTGAMLFILAAGAFAGFSAWWIANWFAMSFLGLNTSYKPTELKERKREKEAKERLEDMHVHDLRAWVDTHPKDFTAAHMLCERYKNGGDYASYCREMKRLLDVEKGLSREQLSMRHHQLADVYMGELRNPEKARDVLQQFVEKYPDSQQARLMRRRIERIADTLADDEHII
ncbi:MAG: tetratricopeptide repeat protein [Candidatus Sumerlaeota bacterium]